MSLSVGARWGNGGWGRAGLLEILRDSWRAPEEEHLSAGALLGEPRGVLRCWGSGRIWGGGLSGRTSLSVGAPLGNLAGGSSIGDLRKLWRRATFYTGALLKIRGTQIYREIQTHTSPVADTARIVQHKKSHSRL